MRLPLIESSPERLGEGRGGPGDDGVLAGQVDSQRGDVGAELGDGLERRDAGQFTGLGHRLARKVIGEGRLARHFSSKEPTGQSGHFDLCCRR